MSAVSPGSWRWSRVLERARASQAEGAHRLLHGWAWRDISRMVPPSTPWLAMVAGGAGPWGLRGLRSPPACSADSRPNGWLPLGSPPITTTSTPPESRPDHHHAHLSGAPLGNPRQGAPGGVWHRLLRPHHRHGREHTTGPGFCRCSPTSIPHPGACRSMPWCVEAHHGGNRNRSIRWRLGCDGGPPLGCLIATSPGAPERRPRTTPAVRPRSSACRRGRRFDLLRRHPAHHGQPRLWRLIVPWFGGRAGVSVKYPASTTVVKRFRRLPPGGWRRSMRS